jgi:DNA primase large subunit
MIRPCFQKRVFKEHHLEHNDRLALIRELYYFDNRRAIDQILEVFRNMSDFNESLSRYHIEHYLAEGTPHKPTRCKILKKTNFCIKEECPFFKMQFCEVCKRPYHYEFRLFPTMCSRCLKDVLFGKETESEKAVRSQLEREWERDI